MAYHSNTAPHQEDAKGHQTGTRLEDRVEALGVPARKLETTGGREEIANRIGDTSAEAINAIPDAKLHALDRPVVLEQLDDRARDIISTLQQLRSHGRLQAGVTTVATASNFLIPGIGIVGAVGSHVLGGNEASAKKRLNTHIEAFCRMCAASGLDPERLREVSGHLGNPLSRRRMGLRVRSLLTTVFIPIARGMHRLINEGKYAEVQYEVERLLRLAHNAPAIDRQPAGTQERVAA